MSIEDDTDDEALLRRLVADAVALQNDVAGLIALHTPDATVVNIAGRRVGSRAEFEQAMTAALDSPLVNVLTRSEIEAIRFVRPDVAIVSCVKHVSDERAATDGPDSSLPAAGRLTYVAVKSAGAWRITSAQTTPVVG